MVNASSRGSAAAQHKPSPTDVIWPTSTLDLFLRTQQAQWNAYATVQRSLLAWNKDLWEQWASHFAGGVPIDG